MKYFRKKLYDVWTTWTKHFNELFYANRRRIRVIFHSFLFAIFAFSVDYKNNYNPQFQPNLYHLYTESNYLRYKVIRYKNYVQYIYILWKWSAFCISLQIYVVLNIKHSFVFELSLCILLGMMKVYKGLRTMRTKTTETSRNLFQIIRTWCCLQKLSNDNKFCEVSYLLSLYAMKRHEACTSKQTCLPVYFIHLNVARIHSISEFRHILQ